MYLLKRSLCRVLDQLFFERFDLLPYFLQDGKVTVDKGVKQDTPG